MISVIVPVRDAEQYIAKCSAALVAQDYPADRFEVIMVDNGSTDASVRLIQDHPRITLLHERVLGAYAARNAGLRVARGEIIAFTDPDCVPDPKWLQCIARAMSDRECQIVVGSYAPARASKALAALAAYENAKNRYVFSSKLRELYYGYTNNMGARASLFRDLGPFLQRPRGSDTVLAKRVVDAHGCDAVSYVDDMRVAHLEIDSVRSYYRKVFVHATSIKELGDVAPLRPLGFEERLLVFRQMVRREGHGVMMAATTFVMLTVGLAYWIIGAARGFWARKVQARWLKSQTPETQHSG